MSPKLLEEENILLQDVVNAYDEYYALGYQGGNTNFFKYSRADRQLQAARKALEDWRKENGRAT